MMRYLSIKWAVLLLLPISGGAVFLGAVLFFYRGSYDPPPSVAPNRVSELTIQTQPARGVEPGLAADERGVVLVDNAHANSFDEDDLSVLLSRVAERGYRVEFMAERTLPPNRPADRLAVVQEKVPRVDSLVIAVPRVDYKEGEVKVLREFLRKGGRILFIGEPSVTNMINGVADSFGFFFQDDLLYNVVEHDLNFRNILIKDFKPHPVTDGLSAIAFYTVGSIKSSGDSLALVDENTYSTDSSQVDSPSPVVISRDGQILAISDFTFLTPPFNATLDNNRFISNIAGFLTQGGQRLDLKSFPHFFKDDVDIVLGRGALFDIGTEVKSLLFDAVIGSALAASEDTDRNMVFLGLYEDAPAVSRYLDLNGVEVGEVLSTSLTPDISTEGTALVLLHKTDNRSVLVVLSDTREDLSKMVGLLESGDFRQGLISENLGIYQVSGTPIDLLAPPEEEE